MLGRPSVLSQAHTQIRTHEHTPSAPPARVRACRCDRPAQGRLPVTICHSRTPMEYTSADLDSALLRSTSGACEGAWIKGENSE